MGGVCDICDLALLWRSSPRTGWWGRARAAATTWASRRSGGPAASAPPLSPCQHRLRWAPPDSHSSILVLQTGAAFLLSLSQSNSECCGLMFTVTWLQNSWSGSLHNQSLYVFDFWWCDSNSCLSYSCLCWREPVLQISSSHLRVWRAVARTALHLKAFL